MLMARPALPPIARRPDTSGPLPIDELRRSLSQALAAAPTAPPLDVDAALSAVAGELGRITPLPPHPAAAPAPILSMPLPRPARRPMVAIVGEPDEAPIELPQALLARRQPALPPPRAKGRGRASVALSGLAVAAVAVGAGVLLHRGLPSLDAGALTLRRPAASVAAVPGRFEWHFRAPLAASDAAPLPPADTAAAPVPVTVAEAETAPAAGAEPLRIMSMTPEQPAAAPLPPIPKAPLSGAALPPAKRKLRPVIAHVAPKAQPVIEKSAPPARPAPPAVATVDVAPLRPVPRDPRPAGVLTLGGPPPTAIGGPSIEYRANIPAGAPSWLPKPDQ